MSIPKTHPLNDRQIQKRRSLNYLILFVFLLCSCIKVPPEAVLLSEAVGERIAAIQASHEGFINDYFQKSRDAVDDFILNKWTPEFMDRFIRRTHIMDSLRMPQVLTLGEEDRIVEELLNYDVFNENQIDLVINSVNSGLGDAERGQFILDFATAAQEQINLQRLEMMNKVDETERIILEELRANYSELQEMQSTVTAHIRSVHKIVDAQDNILRKLDLMKTRDDVIKKTVSFNESAMSILDKVSESSNAVKEFLGISISEPDENPTE